MKNFLEILALMFIGMILSASLWAQSPEKMSYQAVVRDGSNSLLTLTEVGMRIQILQGSEFGAAVYVETQTPITNANGLVSIEIGTGTVINGDFSSIDWANGPYFLKTETDPDGGTSYSIIGTSQLLSVPYAMHAKVAETVIGTITETDPIFGISVASEITQGDITNWNNKLDTETDPEFTTWDKDYNDLTNKPTIPTVPENVSYFTNDVGYLTEYIETDPKVGVNTTGFMSVWDGTALVSGTVFQDVSENIGVGTITPAYKMDISGDMRIFNSNNYPTLYFSQSSTNIPGVSGYSAAIQSPIESTRRDITFLTQYQGSFTEKMRITGNGKVGIGTSNPSTTLSVEGVITAEGGNSGDWNTAYGWGDHALVGYLSTFTELDPEFNSSPAYGITNSDIAYWDNKQDLLNAGTGIDITDNTISTTISVTNYSVGDFAQGGIIFWVDETGQHGLVAAKENQDAGSGIRWNNSINMDTEAHGNGVYSGEMNTMIIVVKQGSNSNSYAAGICANYTVTESGVTYGDWYLPSTEELLIMQQNKSIINATAAANGGSDLTTGGYWSSTEDSDSGALARDMISGNEILAIKTLTYKVRAIRAF
jgi:hypothetical protein